MTYFIIEIKFSVANVKSSFINAKGSYGSRQAARKFDTQAEAQAVIDSLPVYGFCNAIIRQITK
jgi:hypothetical protein